jgi:CPA1 family monovalent cation:H+ antiporter
MRGVVSLAAALAIPVTTASGLIFPHRNLILFITFTVILLTLVVQGLTLPYFIRRSGLFDNIDEQAQAEARDKMKRELREHVHRLVESKYQDELQRSPALRKLLEQWEEHSQRPDDTWMDARNKAMFRDILQAQREYLTNLNNTTEIDEDIIRQQYYQLDLEEERLKVI